MKCKLAICVLVMAALALAMAVSCASRGGASRVGEGEAVDGVEKITVLNGGVPVYKFTLPEGAVFGDYTKITAQFFVDSENYAKTARARAYGAYEAGDFSDTDGLKFVNFGAGDTDKNGPYIVSNVFGSNTALDNVSGGAGAEKWFTLDFPLTGKRHGSYKEEHFPAPDAAGDFYFAVGLGTGDASVPFSYYVKEVSLSSDDGTRKALASGSGFAEPAFAGYTDGAASLKRESVTVIPGAAPVKEEKGPVSITVDFGKKYQKITGFGGMGQAWNSPELTAADIDTMYGPDGLGYNILRLIISHDPALWEAQVAVAKRAKDYGALILASPWTPPAALKSGGNATGGYLLPENYAAYAEHLKSFVDYMAERGVKIDVVSFQNEPDIKVSYDSCDWTASQMLDFVKNYGRAIGDVRIMPGESFQYKRDFSDPLLLDAEAEAAFDIVGGHIYGGGLAPYPLAHEKGKEVWMTEHLLNTEGNFPLDTTWKAALVVAHEIHDCVSADFNAYIWWYLKRFYGMVGDGEYTSVSGQVMKRGYVLSHFAKYASGKTRVEAAVKGRGDVLATAYEGEGGASLVLINLGKNESKAEVKLPEGAKKAEAVETTEEAAMQAKAVRLGGGGKTASVTLAPESVVSIMFTK